MIQGAATRGTAADIVKWRGGVRGLIGSSSAGVLSCLLHFPNTAACAVCVTVCVPERCEFIDLC